MNYVFSLFFSILLLNITIGFASAASDNAGLEELLDPDEFEKIKTEAYRLKRGSRNGQESGSTPRQGDAACICEDQAPANNDESTAPYSIRATTARSINLGMRNDTYRVGDRRPGDEYRRGPAKILGYG